MLAVAEPWITTGWVNLGHHFADGIYWNIVSEAEYLSRQDRLESLSPSLLRRQLLDEIKSARKALAEYGPCFVLAKPECPLCLARQRIDAVIFDLLLYRWHYRHRRMFTEADAIRGFLAENKIQTSDRVNEHPVLAYPLVGRFTHWEMPPFQCSGKW